MAKAGLQFIFLRLALFPYDIAAKYANRLYSRNLSSAPQNCQNFVWLLVPVEEPGIPKGHNILVEDYLLGKMW